MRTPLKALLVEDSQDDALLLMRELQRAGYEPLSQRVETADEMQLHLEQQTWQVVISDFSMPRFSGLEALRIAKCSDPDLPFIIVSGAIGEDTAIAAMRAGAHDYIMKDNLARLAPAISRELREAEARREHRRAEADRRRIDERLQKAEKLEALGELAGGIAHDFNNLLMAIGGSVCLLEPSIETGSREAEELATIHRAIRRGAELSQRLLAVGRQQVLQPIDLDLNELIMNEISILRRVIPREISIELDTDPDLATVHADPVQIARVLMNFCVNSRDAMAGTGTITIFTRTEVHDSSYLGQEVAGKEIPCVRMSVTDTGIGMDEETLAHIFEPFYSTKESGRSSGMGLATVYGIIKQHNGVIDVESMPGQGTRFTILLPAVDRPPQPTEVLSTKPVVGGSETVLVVDDDQDVRGAIVGMLSSLGYSVVAAEDGVQGLEILGREGSGISLVLSDVVMPRMGGQELFIRSRDLHHNLPFLFSSGHTDDCLRQQLDVEQGAFFIAKPFTLEELAFTLRQILAEK